MKRTALARHHGTSGRLPLRFAPEVAPFAPLRERRRSFGLPKAYAAFTHARATDFNRLTHPAMPSTSFAAAVIAIGVLVQPLRAQSMFRGGPTHTGVYSGGGPTLTGLAWRAATDGDVVSSPTIVGNVV